MCALAWNGCSTEPDKEPGRPVAPLGFGALQGQASACQCSSASTARRTQAAVAVAGCTSATHNALIAFPAGLPHRQCAAHVFAGIGMMQHCLRHRQHKRQPEFWLPHELWVVLGSWAGSVPDIWALTATCRAAHRARRDPALVAAWLVRHAGTAQAAAEAIQPHQLRDEVIAAILTQALRLGADPNACDERMHTALMLAAEAGLPATAAALLTNGADRDATTTRGFSSLAIASGEGHVWVVRALLAAGADPHASGFAQATPLMVAAYHGQTEVVKVLLEAGADPNATKLGKAPALVVASMNGHLATVRALLAAGADPNAVREDGVSGLMAAACHGHVAVVEALLGACPRADPNAVRSGGGTALMMASFVGPVSVVRVLLEHGASVHAACDDGLTAADFAAWRGRQDVVRLLLGDWAQE